MARTFGLKISTRLSYDELDSILAQYCRGTYGIHLGGLDSTSAIMRKQMIIVCDNTEDRDRIKAIFAMRGAVKKPGEKTASPSAEASVDKTAEKSVPKVAPKPAVKPGERTAIKTAA
jgi:hypothetical protein